MLSILGRSPERTEALPVRRQVGKATQGGGWAAHRWYAFRDAYFKASQGWKGRRLKGTLWRLLRQL